MKFTRIPVHAAEGAILAHSITTRSGAIKKGRVLTADELSRLTEAGLDEVVVARLEPGDVGEDEAAGRVARAIAGPGTRVGAPFTGRANLFATAKGLVDIDGVRVQQLNLIDEGLTIATVPRFERSDVKQMIGTVKVITFALPEEVVARAEALAGGDVIRVLPLPRKTAGLIMTRLPATKDSVLAKRRQAIAARLEALGSALGGVETVAHDDVAVAQAITRMKAAGADPIIVFAASAIVDRGDVIPAGLVAAGGRIIRLGMPVDPGNLMLLGELDGTDVIGAPSCAASPKLNGFDWVLERRLAGIEVRSEDVAAMGLGGLLKEIATRPQPREAEVPSATEVRRAPQIAAIVLAAGRSTRYGSANKLLQELDGMPIVRRTTLAALQSQARPVIVVTGHEPDRIAAALAGLDVMLVPNPSYVSGLSTSLKAGISALPAASEGAVVCLGDMPRIESGHVDRLISAFAPKEGRSIVVPVYKGKRGNPVLFARELFPEILEASGDIGAKHIIGHHADEVAEVDLGTNAIFIDIDTPEALARLAQGPRNA